MQKIVSDIKNIVDETIFAYSPTHTKWNEYLMQFLGEYDEKTLYERLSRNRSAIYVPKTYSIIKRKVASLFDAYFASQNIISTSAFDADDENDSIQSERLSKTISYYYDAFPATVELIKSFYDMYIFGLGVCRLSFANGYPKVRAVSPNEVFFDLNARSLDDIRYLVNEVPLTASTINKLISKGTFLPNIDPSKMEKIGRWTSSAYTRYRLYDLYELDEEGNWYVSTISGSECLRYRQKLFLGLPFFFGYSIAKPSIARRALLTQTNYVDDRYAPMDLFGDSDCRIVKGLQNELNAIRNQTRDAVRLQLDRRLFYTKQAGLNLIDYYSSGPGDALEVQDVSHLQFEQPPHILESNQEVKNQDLEFQEATGVTSYNSGTSRAGMLNSTATGMSILSSEGNTKIAAEITTVNETFFKPFARAYAKGVFYHAPIDVIRNANAKGRFEFPREDFGFTVSVNVAQQADNKELRKQRLLQLYQISTQSGDPRSKAILDELMPLLMSNEQIQNVQTKTDELIQEAQSNEQGGA